MLSPLTPEPLSLSSSEEMASFGIILLMGGGRSSLLVILGESSLVLLSELSGVLVVGCRWVGLGVSGVLVLGI